MQRELKVVPEDTQSKDSEILIIDDKMPQISLFAKEREAPVPFSPTNMIGFVKGNEDETD